MTDKELAMRLTGALDDRIARASSAPVAREVLNHLPCADTITAPQVKAIPVRQMRWKGVIAAVLVLGMLGGIGLAASKLIDRKSPSLPADSGQVEETQTAPEKTAQVTEPIDPAELPQVSYDADSRTIRISGTTGYDRLDLSPYLDDALNLEVEDDRFQLSAYVPVLGNLIGDELADYLPGYLNRVDRSIDMIGNYIADVAPNEEIAAQTRKPVIIWLKTSRYNNNAEDITLTLGNAYKRHGQFYMNALLNPKCVSWYQLGYVYWVSFRLDPYNSLYWGITFEEERTCDYFYFKDYFRLGGTEDPTDLNNQALLLDVNAWYNLINGKDWAGTTAERCPIKEWSDFDGDPDLEGNDLCLVEAESLLNYLAEQYGHDKVAAFCFETCSFEEAFGMDYATARAAWEQSLMERFGDGSEEPLPDADLPVVSFEEDTKTLRVVGTGNYDHIDLSRLPEAADMIVEDDDFEFRILPTILWSSDSPIEDPVSYLPGYLDEVDKSLATIRQYVADNAPNEDVLAQTQKRVKLTLTSFGSINIYSSYTISLNLNGAFHWVGNLYAIGLNPDWNTKEWRVDAFGAWADYCRNPYCPTFLDYPELNPDGVDIFYYPYYQRAGGTGYLRSVNDRILLNDVISWCNLVFGRDWGGNTDETGRMFESNPVLDASKEENQLSLMESMSLLNYLAGQYGDAKLVAYCFGACSFEEAFGMDFATARAAWEQSLMERFGDGSEEP